MFASAQNFAHNVIGAAGTLFFAGLCIVGATATPANAQITFGVNETGHKVAYVSYADLDLGAPAGRARLENRLRSAAKQVCHGSAGDRHAVAEEYACFKETLKATRSATMAAIEAEKIGG
jgi:UrcA family protein